MRPPLPPAVQSGLREVPAACATNTAALWTYCHELGVLAVRSLATQVLHVLSLI